MLSVHEALALVREQALPLEPRRLALSDADGLVLAEDVASDVDSPPHDKAMMDGYAVVSGDSDPARDVIEEIAAGSFPRRRVLPGTAARIMTGAPVPEGADAVVPVEQTTEISGGRVRLDAKMVVARQHILSRGASIRAGDQIVRKCAVLRPIEIAILAEGGRSTLLTYPRPRVAVLSTGNELVPVDQRPGLGQLRNSNGPMLLAAAAGCQAETIDLGIARDDPGVLRERIEQGLAADVLILSGGVSAGKFDLVPQVLSGVGVRPIFHKIALRPGKPLWFGVRDGGNKRTLVFGLPGNPVSSFVGFELFIRPTIAAVAGRGFIGRPEISARIRHDYQHVGGRAAFLPARISTTNAETSPELPDLEILAWRGSADMATLARANALIELPVESIRIAAGTTVRAISI
jgi:molybdopterin molybdotransferase